jgi:hypothetical protein
VLQLSLLILWTIFLLGAKYSDAETFMLPIDARRSAFVI